MQVKKRGRRKSAHLSSAGKKSSLTMMKRNRKRKRTKRTEKSTWNSGVRKAIRRGSIEVEVRKHWKRVTRAWKQISKQRRRVDVQIRVWYRLYSMVHGWMRRVSKRLVSRRRKKGEASISLSDWIHLKKELATLGEELPQVELL